MSNKRYLLWNNKGGVGKTFLSYNLAVEYALMHTDEDVVVIDACPQTNISEMILGGNGEGAERVSELANRDLTIAGYIKKRFNFSQQSKLGTEVSYFVRAANYNTNMPDNLYLLCGDMDLDICSQLINHMGTSPVRKAWEKSRTLLHDLVSSFEEAKSLENGNRKQTFFIDCNPSFANYTENAILASNRVIIPCTADAASIRGIKNLFSLMFNISVDNQPLSHEFMGFYENVQLTELSLPKVHFFVQNRSRSLDRSATRAFQHHADEISRLVGQILISHSELFTDGESIDNEAHRVLNVKDGNTLAAIINHEGCPLSILRHSRYEIYGQSTQANGDQIHALKHDIDQVLRLV